MDLPAQGTGTASTSAPTNSANASNFSDYAHTKIDPRPCSPSSPNSRSDPGPHARPPRQSRHGLTAGSIRRLDELRRRHRTAKQGNRGQVNQVMPLPLKPISRHADRVVRYARSLGWSGRGFRRSTRRGPRPREGLCSRRTSRPGLSPCSCRCGGAGAGRGDPFSDAEVGRTRWDEEPGSVARQNSRCSVRFRSRII
jgi:hypothetical protein